MSKPYCTQNNGICKTCSLSSYNRDCQNIPLKGGPGKGQGRKPTGRKRQTVEIMIRGRSVQLTGWLDDQDCEYLKNLRE